MDSSIFVGRTLNDYRILRYRGQGAFSFVYEAEHSPTGTEVALKILNPRATIDQIREFDNEGELLVKLSGARRVVNILDSQTASLDVLLPGSAVPLTIPVRFHVLELATGCLDELVVQIDSIPWTERLQLYRDVVLGVHQMHLQSIMHRDLKSSNCLLFEASTSSLLVKVNDLGRARDLTQAAMAAAWAYRIGRGDPNFRPPEMLWGLGVDDPDCHRRADLYGLGCVLFELITGQAITALALYPRAAVIQQDSLLADSTRYQQYLARADEIRSWYESAYSFAALGIPREIRQQAISLLQQLCDPIPVRRLPHTVPGKKLRPCNDLNWLLRRVDILDKTLRNAETQRRVLQNKKA